MFLINLGWSNPSLEEIAPTLEAFLPTEGIRFKLQADSNYYLIQNWTTIFDFYKRQEYERYGEVYSWDAESFDDLNSYKRFLEELFGKLASDKLRLEDFQTKPQSSEIAIIVNSQKFELKVNQDKDWFDEGLIDQVNFKFNSLLPTTEFILLKDSKLSNGLQIALVEKSSQN